MPDEEAEAIRTYLREHSGICGAEALRNQLITAGYTEEEVEQATVEVQRPIGDSLAPTRKGGDSSVRAWPLGLAITVADVALVLAVFFLAGGEMGAPRYPEARTQG